MKTLQTTAIIALTTAALGLSAIAPSFAQTAAPAAPAAQEQFQGKGNMGQRQDAGQRHGGQRGMGGMIGFERGAEGIEIALVRLSHAIDMTADQQALYDTLKTDALAAANSFSTAVDGLRPAAPAAGTAAERPDMGEAFTNRIAFEKARLAALEAVQPSLTAFFDSLTDEQKTSLMPQRGERGGMGQKGPMGQMGQMGQMGNSGQYEQGHRGQRQGR